MKTYKLETVDGHLLAHVPQGLELVDTGAPISMEPPTIVLDAIQRPITHLLGNDELSRSRILLDSVNGVYASHVERIAGEEFALRPCLGVFQIALTFGGQQWYACLDSGAKLSYVTREAVADLAPVGNERDFHPLIGEFDVPVYELTVTVGSRTINGRFGVLPESLGSLLTMFGLNGWILGSDFFGDRSIVLDLRRNLVADVTDAIAERKRLERDAAPERGDTTGVKKLAAMSDLRRTEYRPHLSWTKRDALDYHINNFDNDLRSVMGRAPSRWTSLSIASFSPSKPPRPPMYSEPAAAFRALEDQRWFLCSLFVSQLVDQASHCVTGSVRQTRTGPLGDVRLVGLLGTYYSTMHPAFLLLVLALDRMTDRSGDRVVNGIKSMLAAELRYLHCTVDERSRILAELGCAMAIHSMPASLRAFVPNGEDRRLKLDFEVVEKMRMAVVGVIEHAVDGMTLAHFADRDTC